MAMSKVYMDVMHVKALHVYLTYLTPLGHLAIAATLIEYQFSR